MKYKIANAEILELAATAAGAEKVNDFVISVNGRLGVISGESYILNGEVWDSFTNDLDAHRLGVKLDADIWHSNGMVIVEIGKLDDFNEPYGSCVIKHGVDKLKSIRHAITRAAADRERSKQYLNLLKK